MSAPSEPMKRKDYEEALGELQVELCALQEWVKHKGLRVVVVSRAATPPAGAARSMQSPSGSALACSGSWRCLRPLIREKSQLYLQRFAPHFPAASEIVIFVGAGTIGRASNM